MTTTTQIAGEAMTDEWRTAFDDRHESDVYPEHFMSGLRNEFAAGWHAAMKSQARALLASKAAVQKVCALCGSSGDCKSDDARTLAECGGAWYRPTAPATAKEPIGWLVRGESTHLYFDASNKPGFVVINGNDPVVSIEPHYAAPTAPAQPCGEDAAEQADEVVTIKVDKDRFDQLMDALDRAESKGYMPDAIAQQWSAFEWEIVPPSRTKDSK
jgi:hypothetical protein